MLVPWLNKLFCGLDQWLIVSTRMLKACLDPDLLNILNEIFHFILPTLFICDSSTKPITIKLSAR